MLLIKRALPGLLMGLLVVACGGNAPSAPSSVGGGAPASESAPRVPFAGIVPRAACGPDDRVETGLQGQVPVPDRLSGRAALGYNCNLDLVGEFPDAAFANFDVYKDCAYYSNNTGAAGFPLGQGYPGDGGGVVLDVSDPSHPVKTDYLTAWAMKDAGESLRVNQKRGLLVANYYVIGTNVDLAPVLQSRSLAVYDVATDCRHPKLLADIRTMPTATGHEGCFQPDGMIFYMNSTVTVTAIDLSDPSNPKELAPGWKFPMHGCSISDDGKRGYFSDLSGKIHTVDTSQVQARVAGAEKPPELSVHATDDALLQQSSIPVSYRGHPYLINWAELVSFNPPILGCFNRNTNFSSARILDMADEKNPKEISNLRLEVHDPANCSAVAADWSLQTQGYTELDPVTPVAASIFLYDTHYCRTDRLHDPTILACAQFNSGMRVYDIRDPYHPKELAYYNDGTAGATGPIVDYAFAPPVIRRDLGQIWWVTKNRGFHAAKFRAGVWPFPGDDRCPGEYDYYAEQYDPTYRDCRARRK